MPFFSEFFFFRGGGGLGLGEVGVEFRVIFVRLWALLEADLERGGGLSEGICLFAFCWSSVGFEGVRDLTGWYR